MDGVDAFGWSINLEVTAGERLAFAPHDVGKDILPFHRTTQQVLVDVNAFDATSRKGGLAGYHHDGSFKYEETAAKYEDIW